MLNFNQVLIPDWYLVEKIIIKAENIIFEHSPNPSESSNILSGSRNSTSSNVSVAPESRILVWPAEKSFDIRAMFCPDIHLEEARAVIFELSSGRNSISKGNLVVRASSAGLRLHTGEAKLVEGDCSLSDKTQAGLLSFSRLSADTTIKVKIPYGLDNDMKEIVIRTECSYTTKHGEFVFGNSHTISVALPIGVNVQDVFKRDALFSRFAISNSTPIPLRVMDCHLKGTEHFEAVSPKMDHDGLYVFSKQPACMIYRILRRAPLRTKEALQTRLSMHIKYLCLDEEIMAAVMNNFAEKLRGTELQPYSRLLSRILSDALKKKLSSHELELIGLLREVNLEQLGDFRWENSLLALAADERSKLAAHLGDWQKVR